MLNTLRFRLPKMQQFLLKFAVYFINNFYSRVQDVAGRCRSGPVDAGRAWVIKCRFPADRAQPATSVCRCGGRSSCSSALQRRNRHQQILYKPGSWCPCCFHRSTRVSLRAASGRWLQAEQWLQWRSHRLRFAYYKIGSAA